MPLVIPDVGEVRMLGNIVNKTAPENLVLRLYTNNITPAETDTLATYTEASGNGYASISLTGATWVVTSGNPTSAAYPVQTFTFTGALGNVYGYHINETTSTVLKWAE